MPIFSYQAISETGKKVTGVIEADSAQSASGILVARGLFPSRIDQQAEKGAGLASRLRRVGYQVKTSDLVLFTKQFRSMFRAGIPLLRLLDVIGAQTQDPLLRGTVLALAQDIRKGTALSDAMEKHPAVFSPLYRSMVRAGEVSGNVPDILERIIYIIEHEAKIKADIKAALRYPMMVGVALGIAFFVLLTFVIPNFAEMFKRGGIALPLPTRVAIALYEFLKHYWHLMIAGAGAAIFGLRAYLRTEAGGYRLDQLMLKIPLIGPLFLKAAMSRFASIFSILQASGVPIMNTMTILSDTIGNRAISREFKRVRERVKEGQSIAATLQSANVFTPMVIDMIAIGEESGHLEEMLREIYIHYDDEVNYAVKRLSDAVGPILVVCLAAVVGFFALAIFLPMWDLTKLSTGH